MKPMLATAIDDINLLKYPCYISGKLDGIRILKLNGQIVTRNLKPLRNDHTRQWLERVLPEGADGEVISGNNFQETTSAVMRQSGKPVVQFFWFDWIMPEPFLKRQAKMEKYKQTELSQEPHIIFWESIPCVDAATLLKAETHMLSAGLEGVMVRSGDGPYKHGRSSLREGYLLKLKRFDDGEAEVIGFVEEQLNGNAATVDALGHTKRSSSKLGLSGKNTLGALLVKDCVTGIEFGIGTGFVAAQRKEIWEDRKAWLGRIVKYKSQKVGTKEAPRFPVYLGVRDPSDM